MGLKLLILGTTNLFDVLSLLVLGLGLAFFELRVENAKFVNLSKENAEFSNKINSLELKVEELSKNIQTVKAVQGFKAANSR